eukprot:5759020-Pyramimonas_sp.AAC.1
MPRKGTPIDPRRHPRGLWPTEAPRGIPMLPRSPDKGSSPGHRSWMGWWGHAKRWEPDCQSKAATSTSQASDRQ